MRVIQLDRLSGPHATSWLCEDIDAYLKQGHSLKQLADKAGLGTKTVSRLWYRETQYPRLLTVVMLLKALGYAAMRLERSRDLAKDKTAKLIRLHGG